MAAVCFACGTAKTVEAMSDDSTVTGHFPHVQNGRQLAPSAPPSLRCNNPTRWLIGSSMRNFKFSSIFYKRNRTRLVLVCWLVGTLTMQSRAATHPEGRIGATLRSADVVIRVHAGIHSPTLLWISSKSGEVWRNDTSEIPPQRVYSGINQIPVTWRLRPDLSTADSRHIEFVTNLQLRIFSLVGSGCGVPRRRIVHVPCTRMKASNHRQYFSALSVEASMTLEIN